MKKILIIDDDKALSSTFKAALDDTGLYSVRVVNDSRDAITAGRQFMPDLILLDVIMPGKDGGTIAAEIRADKVLCRVHVVFVTSVLGREEAASRGGKIGPTTVISKPLTVDELLSRVATALQKKQNGSP